MQVNRATSWLLPWIPTGTQGPAWSSGQIPAADPKRTPHCGHTGSLIGLLGATATKTNRGCEWYPTIDCTSKGFNAILLI